MRAIANRKDARSCLNAVKPEPSNSQVRGSSPVPTGLDRSRPCRPPPHWLPSKARAIGAKPEVVGLDRATGEIKIHPVPLFGFPLSLRCDKNTGQTSSQ